MADLTLSTPADAERILDHFNGFHDGFLQKIALCSHDAFVLQGPAITDIAHQLTGRFDAVLDIAHYNYAAGTQPHDRIVHCRFENVREFHLDLRDAQGHDWPIQVIAIDPAPTAPTARFALSVRRNQLLDNRWVPRTDRLFSFERAHFEER